VVITVAIAVVVCTFCLQITVNHKKVCGNYGYLYLLNL